MLLCIYFDQRFELVFREAVGCPSMQFLENHLEMSLGNVT